MLKTRSMKLLVCTAMIAAALVAGTPVIVAAGTPVKSLPNTPGAATEIRRFPNAE